MIVADNSALVAVLAAEAPPAGLAMRLAQEDELHVPHLIDLEFLNVMRRLLLGGKLTEKKAAAARAELGLLPLVRYSHEPFRGRIWALRSNLTAYDAAYIALAEALDASLISCDDKLARSTGHHARVELFT